MQPLFTFAMEHNIIILGIVLEIRIWTSFFSRGQGWWQICYSSTGKLIQVLTILLGAHWTFTVYVLWRNVSANPLSILQLGCLSKKPLANAKLKRCTPMLSSQRFIVYFLYLGL